MGRVSATEFELDAPAVYEHWGEQFVGENGDTVDIRGEVALLNRNIVIRGDMSAGNASADGWGGHCFFFDAARVEIEAVELYNVGQRKLLARYPLHFHRALNQNGSYVARASDVVSP